MASGNPAGDPARGPAGEDAALRRIAAAMAQEAAPAGSVWIGDDAAVVRPVPGPLVLATDAAVAGVHADLSLSSLDDLGWKAFTATVSDIGAVGGRPTYALVTYCAPAGTDLDALAGGVADASAHWECPVVGGDVTTAGQVVVSVAATGTLEGPEPPVLRSGAHPGDALLVTGPLGASAAGLRLLRAGGDPSGPLARAHRRPLARLAEGVAARAGGASAMIDVSDGLGIDLNRLADASGVGVEVDDVPVAPGATEEEAMGGGEDYELVIATADPDRFVADFVRAGLRAPLVIGRCVAAASVRTCRGLPLGRSGWQHPFA